MWRLTIKQTKKSSVSGIELTEKVEFESEDIFDLVGIVIKLRNDEAIKTEYEIKNIEKETEDEQS